MESRARFGIFVVSFLLSGLFFLAQPDSGYAGSTFGGPPCCEFPNPDGSYCYGGEQATIACNNPEFCGGECIFYQNRICELIDGQLGAGSCQIFESSIPTLGEWGLIALAAVLGSAGYMVIRRKKVPA